MGTPTFTIKHYETDEDIVLPCRFEVCDRCRGTGVHDHPAFANGLSKEDFDEDPDFREEYMAGRYDVPCSECGGKRVMPVPNEEQFTDFQRDAWKVHCEIQAEERAERAARARGMQF
jgi:hypothetical protein